MADTSNHQYYGPAGINQQSDQMQIMAEQYVDESDEELEDVTCGGCGQNLYQCICQPDELDEKYFAVTAGCDRNPDWFDFNLSVPESEVEFVKHEFAENHKAQCKCGGEPTISVQEA